MGKTVLVTGITGQDGAYLAKALIERGCSVFGGARRTSSDNTWRLRELGILSDIVLVDFDLSEITNIMRTIERIRAEEIYNLGAQSFVLSSFECPIYTSEINALGPARILEAIRQVRCGIRFYQASTSEMFGNANQTPQTESTPFRPRSPYAASKLYGHWISVNYREAYGIHASCGILFNHESPLRGREFVTRKITSGLALLKHGHIDVLTLGNLDAKRDWGYAADYVDGIHRMVQAEKPGDYVLATGHVHTVREFATLAASQLGFRVEWQGTGGEERAIDCTTGRTIIKVDARNYRPAEVDLLVGLPEKAAGQLGWRPTVMLPELVAMMVETDDRRVRDGVALR